ncbi:hypothetical protein PND20_02515 [Ligilactobacillus ruminis]|uniref:hypothetical protein n=1 Tax=Ligilactobacillus ruminis TaxID=1623 RepID=UPI00232ACEC4|nr:hypothetical protein [Ligilactobacillus ruminis]MDB7641073.1 hypothetical protein [Ligilactobacillus ruminis]MDB7646257.1 hypothetical protein [Ligilactobacillus ruminis]MDB7648224.1 hypothetical protein [Ligilactobacillus ruminis]
MKRYRITYKELNEEHYPLESRLTILDVYDAEIDEGFVGVWIDDSHKDAAPDMAINANLVYKIERIVEEKK